MTTINRPEPTGAGAATTQTSTTASESTYILPPKLDRKGIDTDDAGYDLDWDHPPFFVDLAAAKAYAETNNPDWWALPAPILTAVPKGPIFSGPWFVEHLPEEAIGTPPPEANFHRIVDETLGPYGASAWAPVECWLGGEWPISEIEARAQIKSAGRRIDSPYRFLVLAAHRLEAAFRNEFRERKLTVTVAAVRSFWKSYGVQLWLKRLARELRKRRCSKVQVANARYVLVEKIKEYLECLPMPELHHLGHRFDAGRQNCLRCGSPYSRIARELRPCAAWDQLPSNSTLRPNDAFAVYYADDLRPRYFESEENADAWLRKFTRAYFEPIPQKWQRFAEDGRLVEGRICPEKDQSDALVHQLGVHAPGIAPVFRFRSHCNRDEGWRGPIPVIGRSNDPCLFAGPWQRDKLVLNDPSDRFWNEIRLERDLRTIGLDAVGPQLKRLEREGVIPLGYSDAECGTMSLSPAQQKAIDARLEESGLPGIRCALGQNWDFWEIEADARKRPYHVALIPSRLDAKQLSEVAFELEDALRKKFHDAPIPKADVLNFWTSIEARRHLSAICDEADRMDLFHDWGHSVGAYLYQERLWPPSATDQAGGTYAPQDCSQPSQRSPEQPTTEDTINGASALPQEPAAQGPAADDQKERAKLRNEWLDRKLESQGDDVWSDLDVTKHGGPDYKTIGRWREGSLSTRNAYVRGRLAKAFKCNISEVPQ